MRILILILTSLYLPIIASAQVIDNFEDGDFLLNPTWTGDINKFTVENQILRLTDTQAGMSFLATPSTLFENSQWEFWVRLAFSPSNNNHPLIYLMSDTVDLSGTLNGYFIRIGKDGTANKRIYFFRQTGLTQTELFAGTDNIASGTNNVLRIRVIRDKNGKWDFFSNSMGGHTFVHQGSVADTVHELTRWFGLVCRYTISNANRFYFDDIYAGPLIIDTLPPNVLTVRAISSNTIEVEFSEPVDPANATLTANYIVNKQIGNPLGISHSLSNPHRVILTFPESFVSGETYNITIEGISDLNGNFLDLSKNNFFWFMARKFDVVINEIMADPMPQIGLPAHEYIELYNNTNHEVLLQGWHLQHGQSQRAIQNGSLPPHGYAILASEAAKHGLSVFDNVIVVQGLSPTALLNEGMLLALYNQNWELVDKVNYSVKWYGDPSKSEGGWSLEKIDPNNFCGASSNWKASTNSKGGTPGTENSVRGTNPDLIGPNLLRAGWEGNKRISLFFDESITEADLINPANYHINNNIGHPVSVHPFPPEFIRADLILDSELQQGITYTVAVSSSLTDCAGNSISENIARVAIPAPAEKTDIVLNEILFSPPDGGVRYIELYNRSDKVIDLRNYIISSKDTVGGYLISVREISTESHLIFQDEYRVLTPEPNTVKSQYQTFNPKGFIQTLLPAMSNTSGILVLSSKGQQLIDQFIYHEDMHHPMLTSKKGVALERLNYNWPTQDASNWHSAAQYTGFGTPGYKNSQFTATIESSSDEVLLYPEIFSPDNDGHNDALCISYNFGTPGFIANIMVYDSKGRIIRVLRRGELLAARGIITWNGETDDNSIAPAGIYIILIEAFDLQGRVKSFRKTTVLGRKL